VLVELPLDEVEAGEVVVVVRIPVLLLVVGADVVGIAEDAILVDGTGLVTDVTWVESVLSGRWLWDSSNK
jgi:hypothetical protein